jgi:regulator of protease activity HflC (stomatin/prohibitin superfamily)
MDNWGGVIFGMFCVVMLLALGGLALWGCPQYNVYSQRQDGEAELAKANFSRQTKVVEAAAAEESAKHLANAEVSRAEGVAKANKIIGDSLKENEAYLRYLWILGLHDNAEHGGNTTVYVPTEANLPILEAARNIRNVK